MSQYKKMRLRAWSLEDAAELLWLYTETPDLDRQLPPIATLEDATACLREHMVPARDRGVWAIEVDGVITGCVSVSYIHDMDSSIFDRGWVSYWSSYAIRGQKITRTSVRAVCDWALGFDTLASYDLPGGQKLDAGVLADQESSQLRRLELGYRTNNPASGAIAKYAGFVIEGVEREKFLIQGKTVDAVMAGRLSSDILQD